MMKLWDKGYDLNKAVEKFTVGDDCLLDLRLVKYDSVASIAHAKMLAKIGVLTSDECDQLTATLEEIKQLSETGKFTIQQEDEDCHTAIEKYLVEKLGDVGKKIHTARSRNDQVATALRLYYKDELGKVKELASAFVETLKNKINENGSVVFPGYTHMRKAMPCSIAIWLGAFVAAMEENVKQIDFVSGLIDQNPLGSAVGFGVPFDIDKEFTTKELGFSKVQETLYVQNSRGKFEANIVNALSQVMFDLNKLASDLILFSMPEFGFFSLPKEFCTGSSIMPQKVNPDVLELVRAKYHVVNAKEMEIKSIVSNLISGYHRDFQLTKGPVMQSFDVVEGCLQIMNLVVSGLIVNKDNCAKACTEDLYATKKVYDLVGKGVPFRDAYKQVVKDLD